MKSVNDHFFLFDQSWRAHAFRSQWHLWALWPNEAFTLSRLESQSRAGLNFEGEDTGPLRKVL